MLWVYLLVVPTLTGSVLSQDDGVVRPEALVSPEGQVMVVEDVVFLRYDLEPLVSVAMALPCVEHQLTERQSFLSTTVEKQKPDVPKYD